MGPHQESKTKYIAEKMGASGVDFEVVRTLKNVILPMNG
ncbi:hypothetical protein EYZ11_012981 [Aspergillus tanneri]|uniref:Uncharacterized protein n=1 Tax=Aspergillus tanneri TaxID=1220188 RepID=A0A4S3J481_9EURO|nr:hypothetical protein EYZ11_012981 [Aspergillus tanneri]